MSSSSVQIQEKVGRLMSRANGKPVLRPNRPLSLRDAVANRKPHKGEATCITEMSLMMACWKQHNFVEALCSSEVQTFYSCVREAQAAMKNKSSLAAQDRGRLLPKQATTLLKRFPNIKTEIWPDLFLVLTMGFSQMTLYCDGSLLEDFSPFDRWDFLLWAHGCNNFISTVEL